MNGKSNDSTHVPYYIALLTSVGLVCGAIIGLLSHERWFMPIGASAGLSIGLIRWRINQKTEQ